MINKRIGRVWVEIFKKVKLKLREIVVRFFVPIRNRVKDFINRGVKGCISEHLKNALIAAAILGLGFALFTYNTVPDGLTLEEQILKINIILLAFILPILIVILVYGFINFILKYRKWSLLGAGALGLVLATNVLILINNSGSDSCTALYEIVTFIKGHQVLVSSITILALGLPTFFTLWLFRTHDTQENINNSTFFECARLLATKDATEDSTKGSDKSSKGSDKSSKDSVKPPIKDILSEKIKLSLPKKVALEQLAYLKRKTSFDKEKIDSLTKNIPLNWETFYFAKLSGIDLSGAKLIATLLIHTDLSDAKLIGADLRGTKFIGDTDLRGADLRKADLRFANLSGFDSSGDTDLGGAANLSGSTNLSKTDLRGADLRNADLSIKHLSRAYLSGAYYNDRTNFRGTDYESREARDEAGLQWVSLPIQESLCL